MVSWDKIIKNKQCADAFYIHILPDGMPKSSETKVTVEKGLVSKIVDVQPCVKYRFIIDIEEKETLGGIKPSGEAVFKTAATPSIPTILNKKQFKVGYQWDPIKQVSNLRMVSITFPRDLVTHASCLDYIQVTGDEIAPKRPSLSRQSSTASMTGSLKWDHLGYNPQISTDSGRSTLPGRLTPAGGSLSRGSSPPRGPLAGTYSSSPSLSSQKSASPSVGSPFGPVETPVYANTLPRAKKVGALKKSGPVRVQAPFLLPTIELLVAADANCAEFNYELKFFANGKEVGKVSTMIHLPALADIPSYIPPPITQVMSISFGTSGKPVYGVKTSSGVSAACLPSYFEALDAYRQRLENEVTFHAARAGTNQGKISQTNKQSETAQEQTLKTHGCVCTSPHLEFSTTDAKLKKSHPQEFGQYNFKGMHGAHPYYEKMAGTGSMSTNKATTPASTTVEKSMFLFYEDKKKQWLVGPTLGATKGVNFSITEKTLAKCPGDPPASGTWQRKSTILGRWKKEATLKMACATNL